MLELRLRLHLDPRSLDEATQALRSLVGPVRSEPGCSATRLLRDLDDPCVVAYVEEWRTLDDLKQHMTSPSFRKILAVMDLAARAPTVEIDEIASRRGFDQVEEILGFGRTEGADGVASVHSATPGK
jgi:quinol monooxygenase YgiN